MIDSHTHLDHGPAPEDELVAAAREAGVNRILTIGMDSEGCRSALAAAEAGSAVELVGRVGDDPTGDALLLALVTGGALVLAAGLGLPAALAAAALIGALLALMTALRLRALRA